MWREGVLSLPIPFSLTEALSDSPSISVASLSVRRRRDLRRRFADRLDSLASVSAVWSVSVLVSMEPYVRLSSLLRSPAAESLLASHTSNCLMLPPRYRSCCCILLVLLLFLARPVLPLGLGWVRASCEHLSGGGGLSPCPWGQAVIVLDGPTRIQHYKCYVARSPWRRIRTPCPD